MKKKEEINPENALVAHAQPCVIMHATQTTLHTTPCTNSHEND